MNRLPVSPLTGYELDRRMTGTAKLIATYAASGISVPERYATEYRDFFNSSILRGGFDSAVIPEPS